MLIYPVVPTAGIIKSGKHSLVQSIRRFRKTLQLDETLRPFPKKHNPPNTPKNGKGKHMNHKQKIGYAILGAFIMLIGMSIDNLTSSPVTAQNDGEITCQKLTFVDETGEPLFILQAETLQTELLKKHGDDFLEPMSRRLGFYVHRLNIYNKAGKRVVGVFDTWDQNGVEVCNKAEEAGIRLSTRSVPKSTENVVDIYAKARRAMYLYDYSDYSPRDYRDYTRGVSLSGSSPSGGLVSVYNKAGRAVASLFNNDYGGEVHVRNNQDERRALMSVNEYGNGAVSTWDKNGYRFR